MKITRMDIPEVLLLEPSVFEDARGFFLESWNARDFDAFVGREVRFVQDNHSRSRSGVLRGLHYQVRQPQGKLIRVINGGIFDVAVDVRKSSPTFGRWVGTYLSEDNHREIWIPPGFAHGFLVTSESADIAYKMTDYYAPAHERCLLWNDPAVGVEWPISGEPILSAKDKAGLPLSQVDVFP
jgi:dTDP-4-dehydrorhamnose 3,5-epimerase